MFLECLHYSVHALNNADGRGFGGRGRSPMHWRFVTSSWYVSSCWIYFVHFFHFISSSSMSPQKEKGRDIYRDRANQTLLEQWCNPLVFWISAFPFRLAPCRQRTQRGLKEKSGVILWWDHVTLQERRSRILNQREIMSGIQFEE